MKPTVSVIIPLFNKGSSILRTLDSIANQSFLDFEIIVVDDGSSDHGPQLVETYPDSRLTLLRQSNQGPGAARNTGLKLAKGDYIAFLDADDEWLPNYLQTSIASLNYYGLSVASVTSGYYECPANRSMEQFWRKRGLTDGIHTLDPETRSQTAVHMLAFMSSWSTVMHRDIFFKWNGFYEKNKCLYGEDSYLWLKVLLNHKVVFNLQPLVRYHREDSSLAGNLGGPRPIEPILSDPQDLIDSCPSHLRKLLSEIFTIKAAKTACMLGYWGKWQDAGILRRKYVGSKDWRLPFYFLSFFSTKRLFVTPFQLVRNLLLNPRFRKRV